MSYIIDKFFQNMRTRDVAGIRGEYLPPETETIRICEETLICKSGDFNSSDLQIWEEEDYNESIWGK